MQSEMARMQASFSRVRRMLEGERYDGEAETEMQPAPGGIDYGRIAEITSQRPVVMYVDSRAAAVLMSREMDTAIGNRNLRQLVSMGG